MAKLEDYQAEAQKVYDGQYASKIQSIKNQQASQNQQYDNDQIAYNNLYDKYVKENRSTGIQNQNTYNNQTLARGLGRSSIANTGLAGIKLATDKQEQAIQSERALKLQQLYDAKALYNQQVNDNLNALESEKIGAISEYARKLYEVQMDRELQERLASISRSGYGYGYGSGSGGSSYYGITADETKEAISNLKEDFQNFGEEEIRQKRDVLFQAKRLIGNGITAQDYMKLQNELTDLENQKLAKEIQFKKDNGIGLTYGYVNGRAGLY